MWRGEEKEERKKERLAVSRSHFLVVGELPQFPLTADGSCVMYSTWCSWIHRYSVASNISLVSSEVSITQMPDAHLNPQ